MLLPLHILLLGGVRPCSWTNDFARVPSIRTYSWHPDGTQEQPLRPGGPRRASRSRPTPQARGAAPRSVALSRCPDEAEVTVLTANLGWTIAFLIEDIVEYRHKNTDISQHLWGKEFRSCRCSCQDRLIYCFGFVDAGEVNQTVLYYGASARFDYSRTNTPHNSKWRHVSVASFGKDCS